HARFPARRVEPARRTGVDAAARVVAALRSGNRKSRRGRRCARPHLRPRPMTPPPTPRRILMTTDAVGGVWNYALDLSAALGVHGVEVVLATMGPPPDTDQRRKAALANVTLRESSFRLEWMREPWADVARAGDWLLELEREFAPDLIHLNGYTHAALPWSA